MKRAFYIVIFIIFFVWARNECENSKRYEAESKSEVSESIIPDSSNDINVASSVNRSYNEPNPVISDNDTDDTYNLDSDEPINEYPEDVQNYEDEQVANYDDQDQELQVRVGAVCNDGTESTATGSGACSHHDGVAYWLYE